MPTVPTSNVIPLQAPTAPSRDIPSQTHFAMAYATMVDQAKQAQKQKDNKA
jgi:hypothetical protein